MVPFTALRTVEFKRKTVLYDTYQPIYSGLWYFAKGAVERFERILGWRKGVVFSIGKTPEEYLQTLKENLELAKVYADYYSEIEQKRYADY